MQDVVNRHRSEPTYRPIVIVDDASLPQVAAILARKAEMPDVQVDEVPTRQYPADSFAAHLFGYVGEASEGQVTSDGLHSGAIVGQAGVEKTYNKLLMGEDGAKVVVVNSVGREMETVDALSFRPNEGRRVQLTIDIDLQRAAEQAFKASGFNGAAVVMDPRTGEVLAFTSRPGYDPNDFAAGVERATWNGLLNDPLKPLQNRAIQGLYSPGSTFKIVVALAGLEEGVISPDFRVSCGGGGTFYGRFFQCLKAPRIARPAPGRSSNRATPTSTPSATCSASTRSISGRPFLDSARRPASICRTK